MNNKRKTSHQGHKAVAKKPKKSLPKAKAPAAKPPKKKQNAVQTFISNVGKVFRGNTKYIDKETKAQRDYVVVRDKNSNVTVSKVKSIKKVDADGKNADKALVEINAERYNLPQRTGVDYQRFAKNRMSGKPLDIKDKKVFPEDKERYTLNSKDKHSVLVHTKSINMPNTPKKKR
jgi:hypothetical protein